MVELNYSLSKSKHHFEVLDGLRGVAAIAVVAFHFKEMTIPDYSKILIGHSFLAVDFFFCLSGFVIAYAYDDRIEKMGIAEFFKARLIRLHPLVVLGAILGLLSFFFDPFLNQVKTLSTTNIILMFIASILLIPFPIMKKRGFALFAFNAPAWSLFWEYIANIFYAIVLSRISRKYLLILTILSTTLIGLVLLKSGSLTGGWNKATFWDGGARVAYSFLAGALIYRSNWIIKNNMGFIGSVILLVCAFMVPFSKWNWITEPIIVLFYFPFLVALGAGTTLTTGLKKLCNFSGKISYPIYMTHYSVIWMFAHFYKKYKPIAHINLFIMAGVLALIGFAYLVMVFYDTPVRKYLNNIRNGDRISNIK